MSNKVDLQARWRIYRPYVSALLVFLASRLVVSLAVIFSARLVPQNNESHVWNTGSSWLRYLLRFDAGWYLQISQQGYSYNGNDLIEQPVVFYPLYPLISRLLATLFGLEHYLALLIVSNLAILVAVPLLFKLVQKEYGELTALYAVALLSFFPTALFFSVAYTESLAVLLIVSFFLLLKRERFLLAALCAGLALATRSTGIALLAPLLWTIWRRFRTEPRRLIVYTIVCAGLATSGLCLFMLYLWSAFDSPLAFITAHRAWLATGRVGDYAYPVYLLLPFRFLGSIWQAGPNTLTLEPWFFFLFLALTLIFRKRLSTPYFLFALGVLLLPYFTFGGMLRMRAFTRYSMLALPVFIIMADLLKGKYWLLLCITALFAAMLFFYTAAYAQWYWAG
ncbi:MAG TPA: glycosyltransferase family 39 protein [Pyrinomonadaceae bacterium]